MSPPPKGVVSALTSVVIGDLFDETEKTVAAGPTLSTGTTPSEGGRGNGGLYPGRNLDIAARRRVRDYFDEEASTNADNDTWLNRFYRAEVQRFYQSNVPAGSRVLDLGSGDGSLLASLKPSLGVGIDSSPVVVSKARRAHPDLHFVCGDVEALPLAHTDFDYVVASNLLGYLLDVWRFFHDLRPVLGPSTRLVLTYYNFAWEPLLKLAQRLNLKSPEPLQNWLSRLDIINLLRLADFEEVGSGQLTPVPVGPAAVARPLNLALGALPLVKKLGVTSYVTARPLTRVPRPRVTNPTCSIIVPTRNERGNIRAALQRMPRLGSHDEVIFVDGNSTDGTADEIRTAIADFPHLDVKLIGQGDGIGKGDAVRKGFAAATGDVLMILDADLTVPPEDLPKFWRAIVEDRGELLVGSRLVYPMEAQAMRLANMLGNKFFSMAFSWILDQRITDTLCGTKVMWAEDYRRIAANRHVFGDFDPFGDFDLLFGATNLSRKITELPIRYRDRTYGSTNIQRWRHGVLLLRMAILGARRLRLR